MEDAREELPVPLDMDKARADAAKEMDWPRTFERLPLPAATKEAEAASAKAAEERARFGEELMGRDWPRDYRHEPVPFPTLVDATRGDTEGAAPKLLGSYAFWVPKRKEHEPSEGELVQLKGFFHSAETGGLNFSVWEGRRDPSGNPITIDESADHLYIVEHVACPHERGDRSGSHGSFRRGLICKMCGNLGRVLSSKSARLLARSTTP